MTTENPQESGQFGTESISSLQEPIIEFIVEMERYKQNEAHIEVMRQTVEDKFHLYSREKIKSYMTYVVGLLAILIEPHALLKIVPTGIFGAIAFLQFLKSESFLRQHNAAYQELSAFMDHAIKELSNSASINSTD